ncbi:LysR family transcriptional regulator [Brenneria uluponensis]|uniref:LysR family transcriptional regulator n=1 Tax=Brenneria uluponensis TaxID=3057057 RepID=UPI0028E371DD|nr:LysR family transcriptional regulator [Brenneria ulupoensis]
MDIKLLRAFAILAQQASYHSSAKILCITQPALTKQIQALENFCGLSLFQQGRHGATLTDSGKLLHNRVCDLLSQHDDFLQFIRQIQKGNAGSLSLGFGISTFKLVPEPLLSHSLIDEKLVLAIPTGIKINPVNIQPVFENYQLLQLNPIRGKGLVNQTSSFLSENKLNVNAISAADDIHTLLALVSAGNGVTLLPSGVRHFLPSGGETRSGQGKTCKQAGWRCLVSRKR